MFAVHISDMVLTQPWVLGGWLGAVLLALLGAWRMREEEIPRVALLTAAFFVASSIHIKVPPTSVHLLLNGLVGVVLGRRAPLAIVIGTAMQALLLTHGGYSTIGINSCVLGVPALLAGQLFGLLQRVPWLRRPWFRSGLVAVSVLCWMLSLVYSLVLLASNGLRPSELEVGEANAVTFHPATLLAALIVAGLATWAERRLEHAPEFPIGLLIGEITVLLTLVLSCTALIAGGGEAWHFVALTVLIAQLPLAVIEGIVLGFTVGFLVRVKPEMLGWTVKEEAA